MLTEQIVEVYLNLAGETFAKQMAQDEVYSSTFHVVIQHFQRSYAPDIFAAIIEKLRTRGILTISLIEGFKHLCERAEFHWQEKVQNEEDFGDDIPDEFRGID